MVSLIEPFLSFFKEILSSSFKGLTFILYSIILSSNPSFSFNKIGISESLIGLYQLYPTYSSLSNQILYSITFILTSFNLFTIKYGGFSIFFSVKNHLLPTFLMIKLKWSIFLLSNRFLKTKWLFPFLLKEIYPLHSKLGGSLMVKW